MLEHKIILIFAGRNAFLWCYHEGYYEDLLNDDRADLPNATPHASVKDVACAPICRMTGAGMGDVVNLKRFKKRTSASRSEQTG